MKTKVYIKEYIEKINKINKNILNLYNWKGVFMNLLQ